VTRLKADGSLDPSFGSGGDTTVSFGSGVTQDTVAGVAVDAFNRIILAGTTNANAGTTGPDCGAARLHANGILDSTFGSGGETTVSFGSGQTFAFAAGVAVDASNRVVVAGTTSISTGTGTGFGFAVARLDGGGNLDGSWGSGGRVTTPVPTP